MEPPRTKLRIKLPVVTELILAPIESVAAPNAAADPGSICIGTGKRISDVPSGDNSSKALESRLRPVSALLNIEKFFILHLKVSLP